MRVGAQNHRTTIDLAVPTNRFYVHYGYKDRCSVQVRLEESGEVYLCVAPEHPSYGYVTTTVPFDLFVKEFKGFIKQLAALNKAPLTQLAKEAE